MKVYRATRPGARNTLVVSPGRDHPDVPEWMSNPPARSFLVGGNYDTELKPQPRVISVAFIDGTADVDDRLGAWLIKSKNAFKKPQTALPAALDTRADVFDPLAAPRPKPIEVGRPLAEWTK